LTGGYHVAFIGSAIFSLISALLAGTLLRVEHPAAAGHGAPALAEADS
jgi:hypothetical protein